MEEIINALNEVELDEISGGAGSSKKHIKIVNCKHCVNVRSTPNDSSDDNKLGYAYLGDSYVFYGWSGNWAKIQYGSVKAYVYKTFVQLV